METEISEEDTDPVIVTRYKNYIHLEGTDETFTEVSPDKQRSVSNASRSSFVALECGTYIGDEASITLARCKKYIVRPYNVLLKVIGWRKFQSTKETTPVYFSFLNTFYPIFIFVMLTFACIAQVVTCFSRTSSVAPNNVSSEYSVLSCEDNVFTKSIISYLMILISYALAFYTFRVAEPEHLSSLTERVFLSFNDVASTKSRRKPLFVLLAILVCGVVFFIGSELISICRFFSLRLYDDHTIIAWFTSNPEAADQSDYLKIDESSYSAVHYSLVLVAYLGFMFFDLLYIAVIINYCSQCQLLTYYIENTQDKVRNKKYGNLNLASKEIYQVYEFLKILNGKISVVTSMIFFILITNLLQSYNDLAMTQDDDDHINIAAGFLNSFQWLVATVFPIIFAARLTASGNELRRLGLEIASRPFYYSGTPDLELQFFLTFTESTRYQVTLAFIPMQPWLVLGFGFVVLLFLSSGVVIPQIESVNWF